MLFDDGILKQPKKISVFMNNGNIITLNAGSFIWTNDLLEIYKDEDNTDNDNLVAVFKNDVVYGASECDFEISEKQLKVAEYEYKEGEAENE